MAAVRAVATAGPVRGPWRSARRPGLVALLPIAAVLFLLGAAVTRLPPFFLLAAAAATLFLLLASQAPRGLAVATLGFLPFIGLIRRLTGSYTAAVDPFVLVAPAVAFVCVLASYRRGARLYRTPLTVTVTAIVALGVVQIANPRQGGPGVGLAGAGLMVGPLVWFYVGQLLGDPATLRTVLRTVRILAIVVGVYGTYQLFNGYAGFEQRWIDNRSPIYLALNIGGGTIRPFSTFTSNAEYGLYLALGAVLWASAKRVRGSGILVALLLVGCVSAGSRVAVVTGILAAILLWFSRRGERALGASIVVGLAVIVVASAALSLFPEANEASSAGRLWNRTVGGLANPFDSDVSTLGQRLDGFRIGVLEGLANPVGGGSGLVNSAGKRLGQASISGDHDIPNVFIAFGWMGAFLLVLLVIFVYRTVDTTVRSGSLTYAAPALFALALFGQWFVGELYAVGALTWFFVGALDRRTIEPQPDSGDAEPALAAAAAT